MRGACPVTEQLAPPPAGDEMLRSGPCPDAATRRGRGASCGQVPVSIAPIADDLGRFANFLTGQTLLDLNRHFRGYWE